MDELKNSGADARDLHARQILAVANGAVVDSSLPEMPRTHSAPIRLSFAPEPATPGRGPANGEHTDQVLSELGYGPAEIDRLRRAGALG